MRFPLQNISLVMRKIPDELFAKLKAESEIAKNARYNNVEKQKMISGLTDNHVPEHYYVTDTREEFDQFTMSMFDEFVNESPMFLSAFKFATRNMGFVTAPPWFNIQEKGEYIPNHTHDGLVSFAAWIKIPYDVEEECKHSEDSVNSCLQFNYQDISGKIRTHTIHLSQKDEGHIIMFPSDLTHCVYPFYTSDDVRISISGCISLDPTIII